MISTGSPSMVVTIRAAMPSTMTRCCSEAGMVSGVYFVVGAIQLPSSLIAKRVTP